MQEPAMHTSLLPHMHVKGQTPGSYVGHSP